MPQKCRVCELGEKRVHQIERDYLDGKSITSISKEYDVGYFSIRSHIENHISNKLVIAAEQQENESSLDLMARLDRLLSRVEMIFNRNYEKRKDTVALKALREERSTIELLAKISWAMHQNKMIEIESEKDKLLNVDLPMYMLSKPEQDLYFNLNRKLLGEDVKIELSSYLPKDLGEEKLIDKVDGSASEDQNISKSLRTQKPDPEEPEESLNEFNFKPISQEEESIPVRLVRRRHT